MAISGGKGFANSLIDEKVRFLNAHSDLAPVDRHNSHCQYRANFYSMVLAAEGYLPHVLYVKSKLGVRFLNSPSLQDPNDGEWVYHVAPILIPQKLLNHPKLLNIVKYSVVADEQTYAQTIKLLKRHRPGSTQLGEYQRLSQICPSSKKARRKSLCPNLRKINELPAGILVYDPQFSTGLGHLDLRDWVKKIRVGKRKALFLWTAPGSFKSSAYEPDFERGSSNRWTFYNERRWRFQKPAQDGNGLASKRAHLPPFSLESLLYTRKVLAENICDLGQETGRRLSDLRHLVDRAIQKLSRSGKLVGVEDHQDRIGIASKDVNCRAVTKKGSPWSLRLKDRTGEKWLAHPQVQKAYQKMRQQ